MLIVLLSLYFTVVGTVQAHNKVVVVPLGEDGLSSQNLVVVSLNGGDFRRIEDAVESITDASETNSYLVYVEPGEYRLRKTLKMKPFVDVVGSGIGITTLIGRLITEETDFCSGIAVVTGGRSKVSNLTIRNSGSFGESRRGLCARMEFDEYGLPAPRTTIEQVEIIVSSASSNIGIWTDDTIMVNDSSVSVVGGSSGSSTAIYADYYAGYVQIFNSSVTAEGGHNHSANTLVARGIDPPISGAAFYVTNTSIVGPIIANGSAITGSGFARFTLSDTDVDGHIELNEYSSFTAYAGYFDSIQVDDSDFIIYNSLIRSLELLGDDKDLECYDSRGYGVGYLNQDCTVNLPP